jgi:hypothetical protein
VKLPRDWNELIELLCSHRVRFVIVGAHALAVHGRPRATGDLDVLVDPTRANAKRLGKALAAFGFTQLAEQAEQFALPDRMVTLGREPLRIDIMTSISGVPFVEAWTHRMRVEVEGLEVGFLGRDQFVKNKTAAGRPKDLLDLALLDEGLGTSKDVSAPRRRGAKRGRR